MKYLMSGIDHQTDRGFGINAEAFKKSADFLIESEEFTSDFIPQKHMPIFFLYRHSIELFFKSLIVIFHSELALPYPNNKPQILTEEGKWRDLDNCHWIDSLYWYWSKILTDKKDKLDEEAPKGSWMIHPDLEENIKLIASYDKDSTFFRYPFTKRNPILDSEKYSVKKVNNLKDINNSVRQGKGSFTLILTDEDENISSIYSLDENVMSSELVTFKETSDILSNYHIMTRMTLCQGF
ncbi:hypothetical protein U5N28_19205 [Lysinibacillus telephonicus]|uniref:hypothetical protein n=1 Tax=Lysinibacillus telephonicus TaxID=1714840 RepID=UPI0039793899